MPFPFNRIPPRPLSPCSSKSPAEHISILTRPYLEEFLIAVYQHYDIAFWSQTSWRWLEAKLTEMQILTHHLFKVCFVMDKTTMFEVRYRYKQDIRAHEVKALQIIWEKVPQFHSRNTIHIDDLSRNFVMNPKNGLKVKAFKNAPAMRDDQELLLLKRYLLEISQLEDLTKLDHGIWKDFLKKI